MRVPRNCPLEAKRTGWPWVVDRREFPRIVWFLLTIALASVCQTVPCVAAKVDGRLEISVVDSQTGKPLPVRMRIKNSRGRDVRLAQSDLICVGNSIYFEDKGTLGFRRGQYTFELDAGPEYRTQSGHFEIDRHADDTKTIKMNRFADLESEGWYAGDLALGEIADKAVGIVMRAQQLHVAPTVDWQSQATIQDRDMPRQTSKNRWYAPLAGVRSTSLEECFVFNLSNSADQIPIANDLSSLTKVVRDLRKHGSRIVSISPLAHSLPALLATGQCDALHVLSDPEVLGLERIALRDRDKLRYPGKKGMGRYGEFVYFQMLEAGLRVVPVAGSGWPLNEDFPPGSHRVYVHCEKDFTYHHWWEALSLGRVMVTNGPLLRPMVEGQPPGYVFHIRGNQELELEIGLQLASREPVEYLEIIRNGQVEFEIRLQEFAKQGGKLPKLRFKESGWFLLRAITTNSDYYQRAISAPYYVEKEGQPRVSRQATQFFLDWIDTASESRNALSNETLLKSCRPFWQQRLSASTVE